MKKELLYFWWGVPLGAIFALAMLLLFGSWFAIVVITSYIVTTSAQAALYRSQPRDFALHITIAAGYLIELAALALSKV
ncbi:MAG: hypothetical protein P8Y47_11385 [Alphaproteobacteria bacterium]